MILIYTDGSSRGNPGAGGWAFLVKDGEKIFEQGGAVESATNNQMELLSFIKALEFIKEKKLKNVLIRADSEYVLKGVSLWLLDWKKNNWKNSQKKEVKNKDLWLKIDALINQLFVTHNIKIEHVRGHSGERFNDRVDEICTKLALGEKVSLRKDDIY